MPKKILVVDDEPDILEAALFRMKAAGYAVVTAKDGLGALEIIKKDKPDLILLDLALPGMRGDEVCKTIKADAQLKAIPVVIFTASVSDKNLEERVKSINADGYLVKPFEAQDLLDKVKQFLT